MNRRSALTLTAAALLMPLAAEAQSWEAGVMQRADMFQWSYLADTVMGGVSEGAARMERTGGMTFLRLTGNVSTENRGGFIQARTALPEGLPDTASGLRIRVRGNGERYFLHLRTTGTRLPWQYYQAGFETGPDWALVDIPFAAFSPSGRMLRGQVRPDRVRSVGLVAYGRDHQADVSLAEIGTY